MCSGTTRSGVYADLDRARRRTSWEPRLVERRETREPLAYVLGEWGFRRLTLKTDARALVPRPETEIVVERGLGLLGGVEAPRVLDLGVGSGAIALAIKDERPDARVTGVDVSPEALSLARENAELLGLDVELREGGIDDRRPRAGTSSSPTRRTSQPLDGLQPEIQFEPESALVIGAGFHEAIARAAQTRFLVLEVGDGTGAPRSRRRSRPRRLPRRDGHARSRRTRASGGGETMTERRRSGRRRAPRRKAGDPADRHGLRALRDARPTRPRASAWPG